MDSRSHQKEAYDALVEQHDTEDLQNLRSRNQSSRWKRSRRAFAFIGAAVAGGILLALLQYAWIGLQTGTSRRLQNCGSDSKTAEVLGCYFDSISFAWETPECFDEDLNNDYKAWANWTYYEDFEMTKIIPSDVIYQGHHEAFVSWDQHVVHCTFMYRQMHRAYERGYIDSHLRAYHHTLHCQDILLSRNYTNSNYRTSALLRFPECEKVRQ